MISPLEEDDFIKVFNATAQQFLLPIRVDYEDDAPANFWKIKGDGSITFLSKNIDVKAYPTKIPREKFPSQKIISKASGIGYRPGEQMFFPIKAEEPKSVSEAKLLDRKPSLQAGDEEIQFRKSTSAEKIELISPPLPFDDIHIDQVKWVINILKRMRMKVNASTGIHVHVSFNELDLFNFTKLLKNVDEKKIKELWPTRFNTTFTKKKDDIVDVVKKYFSNLFDRYMNNDDEDDEGEKRSVNNASINNILAVANNVFERYYGINIKAFTQHGTIEFRYAGSELKDKKVVGWLEYIRALIEKSLKQDKVKIGEFEITSTNGILSITSDLHPGEVLTSNSIIDQFSFKENAKKSVRQFLQEKNLLDNKEKILKQINEYPYHVTVKQPHLKIKIKALEGFMTFVKAVVKEGVIGIDLLNQDISDHFNDVLQAYIAKELINSGIAEFSNFINLNDQNMRFSNRANYILDNIDDKAVNKISTDGVKYIVKSYAKNNDDEELILFLKKLDSDKVDSAISSFEPGSDVAVSITFVLTNTKSIDNMRDVVGIKLSDDTLLKLFSKENLNKVLNSTHDASAVEAFLVRSFSPLSTKILEDNFVFEITDNTSVNYHAQSVVSAFNEMFSEDQDFNKKNLDILVAKLKSILPETMSGRLKGYVATIDFNNKLINDKLTYDDIVEQYNIDSYIVNSQQTNYIVKTKNKFGIFAIILSMSNQKQIKQFLDSDSKLKDEINSLLKRFVKTADISGNEILNLIISSVDFYGFNDLLKQEYFNRIKLSQNELNDFLSNASNTDAIETKYLEIFDLLLGVESNKKLFVKNIPFQLITANRKYYFSEKLTEYLIKTLKKFSDEIDYDNLAERVSSTLFSADYSRYSPKEENFIKSITDPDYMPFIDIPKFRNSVKKEIHKNFNQFVLYVISSFSDPDFKLVLRQLVNIFEIQNPMIEYLVSDEEDDEKLKSVLVSINNGDVLSSIILEKMLRGITNYSLSSVDTLNKIKSQTLLLQVLAFGVNKNINTGNLTLWLNKFFGLKEKIPDVNFLEKLYSINANLLSSFLQRVGSGWSDYKLQRYIAENYEDLKKSPFFNDVQKYWIDEISIQEKIIKSGFTTVKWKKTYDKLENEDEIEKGKGISNTNIRITGNKSSITFIINSQKFQFYKYENTYTLISKDFHEQEKTVTERPPNTNNAMAYLSVFEDRVPDLLTTSQWKSLQLIIKLVVKNIEEMYGFEKSGSDTIRFEKDKQLSLFPEEDKEEVKPEEETVKEEVNYSKKFKEIMLTEGIQKAKVFLKKNKDSITDRKLVAVMKQFGIR